jgi:hypothetical protein
MWSKYVWCVTLLAQISLSHPLCQLEKTILKRNIPTERPLLVGGVSAHFWR